ncbi:ATP-binding protein [Glycomyces sp. NPDC046736]|uniref:DEAD/DEAH box helicase n=1 Tax=Glycomyces sp. NPDC046736 TaxID=3155615 RepID=UPI0033C874B6
MTAARILEALAELAPTAKAAPWGAIGSRVAWGGGMGTVAGADELAAYDELHRDERSLRQGFGIVMGRMKVDGKNRQVAIPLAARPVRLEPAQARPFDFKILPAGDIAVHPSLEGTPFAEQLIAVFDPDRPAELLAEPEWLAEAARAAGYPVTAVEPRKARKDGPAVVLAQPVVFIADYSEDTPIAKSLREWAARPGIDATALDAVYRTNDSVTESTEDDAPRGPLPLSREQAAAVALARRHPVTVVTGAPGCGKSHTLAAIALDAIASGQSVLIATQSVHAADVLGGILERHPGPRPIQFGDSERDSGLTLDADRRSQAKAAEQAAADARAYTERIETEIATGLELERRRLRAPDAPVFLLDDFPGLREAELDEVETLAALAHSTNGSLWRRWKCRRARARLTSAIGTIGTADSLRRAVEVARDVQAAAVLSSRGGLDLGTLWRALETADADCADAAGTALKTRPSAGTAARRALTALDTALRKGNRGDRRRMLAEVDTAALLKAAPLWIGTVADTEAVLPPVPGLFDLVILDEASHINQLRAAPVLARARRAVVAGDPKQLRFVSFTAERRLHDVLDRHGLRESEYLLDTGRVSAYDLARGAGPVAELTEHHRSVPHLIGFSADRFYNGRVAPVTTHPRNHEADAISVHRVSAEKADASGVVGPEVERAVALLAELVDRGERGLAVLSPFRAQAEAIEAALMKRFDLTTIRERRIRSGTVHAFQGSEAETVIAALGVADGDNAGRKRFLAGANLFNVMVTRARAHLHVVTALTEPTGLVGEFLDYADRPPRSPEGGVEPADWTGKLAGALAGADATVRVDYPVGHWTVDLVVGEGDDALGVVCLPHPEGPQAHLARHRALRRAGWRLVDAFPSASGDDPSRAAVAVLAAHSQG